MLELRAALGTVLVDGDPTGEAGPELTRHRMAILIRDPTQDQVRALRVLERDFVERELVAQGYNLHEAVSRASDEHPELYDGSRDLVGGMSRFYRKLLRNSRRRASRQLVQTLRNLGDDYR